MNAFKHFTQKGFHIYGLHFKDTSDINQVRCDTQCSILHV